MYVSDPEEVFRILQMGASNRKVAATRMNDESSRSHSIFQIMVPREAAGKRRGCWLFLRFGPHGL